MSTEAVLALLEKPWGKFRGSLEKQAMDGLGKNSGTFRLTRIDLELPPGYVDLTETHLVLALPDDPQGWEADFSTKVGVLDVTVEIRSFRVLLELDVDQNDPDRPRLQPGSPRSNVSFHLRLEGLPALTIDLDVRMSLPSPADGAISIVSQPHPSGANLELALVVVTSPETDVSLKGAVHVPLLGSFPVNERLTGLESMPPTVLGLLTGNATQLPLDWGGNVLLPPAPAGTPFAAAAQTLESSLQMNGHLPDGTVFDLRSAAVNPGFQAPGPGEQPLMTYDGYIDSAIWTGHYLAGEAFRYHTTSAGDRDAVLERIELCLGGVNKLLAITEVDGLLARCVLDVNSPIQPWPSLTAPPEKTKDRYYPPTPLPDGGRSFVGYGAADHPPTRDQYTGIVMGLAYSFYFLGQATVDGTAPDARVTGLRNQAGNMLTSIVDFLLGNDWAIPTPPKQEIRVTFLHNFIAQLTMLRTGLLVDAKYQADYDAALQAFDGYWIDVWATCLDPIGTYYKYNLLHGQLGLLLFFAGLDNPPMEQTDWVKALRQCLQILRRTVKLHRNAYFNLTYVLAARPEERAALLDQVGVGCDPTMRLRDEIPAILLEWLQRANGPVMVILPRQMTPDPAALMNLFPDQTRLYQGLFPKISLETGGFDPADGSVVALSALPVDKRPGSGMDFLWQHDPFSTGLEQNPQYQFPPELLTVDPGDPSIESPGVDYLLAYWMAKYLGVVE